MSTPKPHQIVFVFAVIANAACPQSATGTVPDHGADAVTVTLTVADSTSRSSSDAAASDDDAAIDCARVFSPSDVAGLMSAPAKVSKNEPRNGSCTFDNGHSSLIIYTGGSFTSEMTWNDVMGPNRAKYVALPGVGDQALRKADDGTNIYSRKGKIYCSVGLPSDADSHGRDYTKTRGEALSKQLGVLCNKFLAAN